MGRASKRYQSTRVIKHRDLDVQFDQSGEAVDGFLEVDGLGVEIDFFDFCVGKHHEVLAPERNREHSIGDQVMTLNVGIMERLRSMLITLIFTLTFSWRLVSTPCRTRRP